MGGRERGRGCESTRREGEEEGGRKEGKEGGERGGGGGKGGRERRIGGRGDGRRT